MRKLAPGMAIATGVALAALGVPVAHADVISIGFQQAGVNGGAITTENTGSSTVTVSGTAYGTWSINTVTAFDTLGLGGLPGLLNSNSINTSSQAAGTLTVWITAQGLTTPVSVLDILSSFTSNNLTMGVTGAQEYTYVSAANALYGGASLSAASFSGPSNTTQTSSATAVSPFLSGPFSVTEEYVITANGQGGNANLTIDMAAVPEPESLAILASGLLALTMMQWRRRQRG
ncbi:MAG: PEP-CTERM sorting domain-containing protein [Rhodospirillales bacterium]|nr:PEP-CTERM sorting domain-containing protein [Rhodospirillales bacterium]